MTVEEYVAELIRITIKAMEYPKLKLDSLEENKSVAQIYYWNWKYRPSAVADFEELRKRG